MQIILASTSAFRRALLERLGLPFQSVAPEVDESRLAQESPEALAERLSLAKALAVAARHPDALVIGSDQVAALDDLILGKPGGYPQAMAQLAACSGREVVFHTGLCVITPADRQRHVDRTRVTFRTLSTEEIERYLKAEQPYQSAGSFKVEGLGISLFETVKSEDPTALIGLPLIALCRFLRQSGVAIP
ncbi:MAG TPA: Maf family nucleotide pyrophosphatase [Gammaproteobacteria bacterium]|nr:Maf family nucleotide pyrophosphatase [Gammaproteobacteria bacterium]